MIHSGRGTSWTIFRYIISETALSFMVAFLFFFFIFFINQILLMAEEILSKKVPLHQVALLIFYSLPAIVAMAAPFAALVGTLMSVGRLSSDNEVLVLLSSGLSYRTLFFPILFVGIIISLFSFISNDILLPAGTVEFGKLYRTILVSTPALELQSNSVKKFKNTVIVTGEAEGNTIEDIVIIDRTADGERRFIFSQEAELREGTSSSLTLDLSKAFLHIAKESAQKDYDYAIMENVRYSITQQDIMQSVGSVGPREMSSPDVANEILKKEKALFIRSQEKKANALASGLALENSLRQGPSHASWNQRSMFAESFGQQKKELEDIQDDRNLQVYRLEYYKKFSIPFGAVSFIFLALPLGLFAKKSGQTMGFAIGLIIAVLYWALLIGGQTMGVRLGYSPFWAMWLPNALAIGIGLLLSLYRISR